MAESRPPFPPFDLAGALQKVQAAEDAWNTRDPARVSLAYTPDSVWRNRDTHVAGREQIVEFRELAPGQPVPFTAGALTRGHQGLLLGQGESRVAVETDGGDEPGRRFGVAALPGDPDIRNTSRLRHTESGV